MTVTFENSDDDLVLWYESYYTHTRSGINIYRSLMIFAVSLGGILGFLISLVTQANRPYDWIWMGVVSVIVSALLYIPIMRHKKHLLRLVRPVMKSIVQTKRARGVSPHLFLPQTVDVTNEGVAVRWNGGEFKVAWDTGQCLEETENHFQLVLPPSQYTPLPVVQIPKRAFASEAQQAYFREQVTQHLVLAKGNEPVTNRPAGRWWSDRNQVEAEAQRQRLGPGDTR